MKRIVGIGVVWVGCCFAWVVLGSTLLVRSDVASASGSSDVYGLWGPPADQRQPTATYDGPAPVITTADPTQRAYEPVVPPQPGAQLPLVGTDVDVSLALEHRRRGLNWYPTYTIDLDGTYRFRNPSEQAREATFHFPLSSQHAVFDGFSVQEDGADVAFEIQGGEATWTARMDPGQERSFRVAYRSRGTESWHYRMAQGTSRTTDFRLDVTTDFSEVDFPEGTLSPTSHTTRGGGWTGSWDFDSLIASQPIGIELPRRLDPGPLAARITFFAPVGLLFFFFVVGILAMASKKDLHPMHYFFLGCAFFAFHLLFAYLVDHLPIAASFGISAACSTLLVVSYARLFTGWRFALVQVGVSQLLYLVLFSLTFMWEGFTGLSITVGAILTLFVMMQITGKTPWGRKGTEPLEAVENPPEPAQVKLDASPKAF